MATLLNQATDSWSFDKLIQPLSNPGQLEELLSYLNGKHKSYQHDHIDPIALSRILIAIKFVSSKKKLFNTLKPCIDELLSLCASILNALKNENKLSKSSPWLWLETILVFMSAQSENNTFPYIDLNDLSNALNQSLKALNSDKKHASDKLPQFLFADWCFATKNGTKIFEHNFQTNIEYKTNEMEIDSDDSNDDDLQQLFGDLEDDKTKTDKNDNKIKPKSRTLSNIKFLSFPRPNPPQKTNLNMNKNSNANINTNMNPMRKRQKISSSSYCSVGGRKFSAINDKLTAMRAKNEKKNSIRLLSIQQKRQMREDTDRREQERKYQIEQNRKEKERLKKLEKEKLEREEKEKQQQSLILSHNIVNDVDNLDDFDAFMNDDHIEENNTNNKTNKNICDDMEDDQCLMLVAPGSVSGAFIAEKKEEGNTEELRLINMGIPKALHKFSWLHTNCNQLSQANREKIVKFLTGKFSLEGVEKEDVLLNRMRDSQKGVTKDSVFRMFFKTKKWKKVVLSRRIKKKIQ